MTSEKQGKIDVLEAYIFPFIHSYQLKVWQKKFDNTSTVLMV